MISLNFGIKLNVLDLRAIQSEVTCYALDRQLSERIQAVAKKRGV